MSRVSTASALSRVSSVFGVPAVSGVSLRGPIDGIANPPPPHLQTTIVHRWVAEGQGSNAAAALMDLYGASPHRKSNTARAHIQYVQWGDSGPRIPPRCGQRLTARDLAG